MAEQLTLNQLVGSSSLPRLTTRIQRESPVRCTDRTGVFASVPSSYPFKPTRLLFDLGAQPSRFGRESRPDQPLTSALALRGEDAAGSPGERDMTSTSAAMAERVFRLSQPRTAARHRIGSNNIY